MKIKIYIGLVRRAARFIESRLPAASPPRVAVILGSGLSKAVPRLDRQAVIPYERIPAFPRTTVSGHEGKLILGRFGGSTVAVMQGRFHYYEGHSMESIALPIRALEYIGLKTLVITSAVGSMRPGVGPGHIVVIKDHINLMGRNPIRAFHEEEFGDMFPDMLDAYDPSLRRLALGICRSQGVPAREGVYAAVGGPTYETPAEVLAFRRLGADVVGMSVVPEVVVARQMGMRVLALSWVANMAAGIANSRLSHPDVLSMGETLAARLRILLEGILKRA